MTALPIAAIKSSCAFIEKNVVPRRCDSDGVSGCWRCQSVALSRWMTEALPMIEAHGDLLKALTLCREELNRLSFKDDRITHALEKSHAALAKATGSAA